MTQATLKAGGLAYFQSITRGWIPCRVVTIDNYASGVRILARITARHRQGELIDTTSLHIAPRACVRRVRGSYGQRQYITPYQIEVTREA